MCTALWATHAAILSKRSQTISITRYFWLCWMWFRNPISHVERWVFDMFKRVQTDEPFSSHHRALDLELQLHMLKQDVSCFFPLLSHVQPSPGPFCSAWVDRYGTRTTTATLEIARIWVYADVVRCYLCSRSVGRLGFAYHLWFRHNFTAPKARFQWLYK